MRRALLISAVTAAVAIAISATVTGYAVYNLSTLIARNRGRILNRLSAALGRPVEVGRVQAHVGWGVSIEIDGLKIADDPRFSQQPFLTADRSSLNVEFMPLLGGKVRVRSLDLYKPNIRILKNSAGRLSFSTLGENGNRHHPAVPARRRWSGRTFRGILWAMAEQASIKSFSIEDGTVYYSDATLRGVPLQINHLSTRMNGFHSGFPFTVKVACALFSERPDIQIDGTMGPMLHHGVPDVPNSPVDLTFAVGPLTVDNVRTLLAPGAVLPVTLEMPDPVSINGTMHGSLAHSAVRVVAKLSNYRVLYTAVSSQHGKGPLMLGVSGRSTIDGTVNLIDRKAGNNLTATLNQVDLKFKGAQIPAVSNLNATIQVAQERITVQRAGFMVGGGHASLAASANSIRPLKATFNFQADNVQLSRVLPSRPAGEFVKQLTVSGTAAGQLSAPVVDARIESTNGMVERLAYTDLDLTMHYASNRMSARPLSMSVFRGSLQADIDTELAARPPVNASLSFKHIDVSEALRWQKVRTTAISGFLTGNARLSGRGAKWAEIEPTLHGSGRLYLSSGTLEGVNIVALAINKVAAAPVVSQLVSAAFRSSHEGLLASPGTDLRRASMTFTLNGIRVATTDLLIQSPDYEISGDGWFDFDRNISMTGDIKLTMGLSPAIPVVVMGRYPALLVLPNIPRLAERVAVGAVNTPINALKQGAKGLGAVIGGVRSLLP